MAPTIATVILYAYEDPTMWLFAALFLVWVGLMLWHAGSIWLRRLAKLALASAFVAAAFGALLVWAWHQADPGTTKDDQRKVADVWSAVFTFYATTGQYPSAEQGWQALLQPPDGLKPLLGSEPTDRFGRRLHYSFRDGRPCVIALGRDGELGTEDDITHASCRPLAPDPPLAR